MNPTAARAALYCRVSTAGQTVEPQRLQLDSYAAARGLEVVEVYADEAVSGATARRPALDRMMADARRRRFDVVVVAKLDRIGRSLLNLLELLGELEQLGVDFASVDDALDTRTAAGRLFFQIRAAFAEYERALIRERTRAGLAAARRRGVRLGRRPVLDAKARARVHRLHRTGKHSVRRIAELVGVSKSAVFLELKRRTA